MSTRKGSVPQNRPQITEEELLRRQIAIVQSFKGLLQNEASVAAQTVAAFSDLLDDCILDVAQEVHREARTGTLPPPYATGRGGASGAHPVGGDHEDDADGIGGGSAGPNIQPAPTPPPPLLPQPQPATVAGRAGTRGPVDVFGQSHPAKATDVVTCRNCRRQVQAGSFAPHLEKCMGKGRAAARAASRRMQGQA
jgi:hypothetical protein